MPSGRVHSAVTAACALGASVVLYKTGYPLSIITAAGGGCLLGLVVNPDLDVDQGSISNKIVRRSAGCVLGLVWSLIWKPYALVIPHRSPLSHFPILGTVIRLGYLYGLLWLINYGLGVIAPGAHVWPSVPFWWLWSFAGLALVDAIHFLMDQTIRN